MKIPRHWAKATATDTGSRGEKVVFSCWRWSDESQQAAQETALAAAKRVVQSMIRGAELGRYGYGNSPLREELIERVDDPQGNLIAAVTRNSYGALVLNTANVMFVDVDFPEISAGEGLKHLFGRLFGRSAPSPESKREQTVREDLQQFLEDRPQWGMRVYRTFAGIRVLVTQDLFDPKSDQTFELLRTLGCDPLYARLCKAQECFRARLTPKPWRCGHSANTVRYPFDDAKRAEQFARWNAQYAARQKGYATCRFLGTLGSASVHPHAERIVELHDYSTRASEPLALA